MEDTIANDRNPEQNWSIGVYGLITSVAPLLSLRDTLAHQEPTDTIVDDIKECDKRYKAVFAGLAKQFDLAAPPNNGWE
jgi:hypothetical protein